MNIAIAQGQTKAITLSPNGPLAGAPNWNRISGTCQVDVAPDGLSAQVVAMPGGDTGRTIFAITAQSGNDIIGEIVGIMVSLPEASSLNPIVS